MWKKKREKEPEEVIETLAAMETVKDSENSEKSEYSENSDDSESSESSGTETLEAYRLGAGIQEEEFERILETVRRVADCAARRDLNPEILTLIRHGLSYERDIDVARAEGELKGRNAAIVEEFRDLRADKDSDGIPDFGGTIGLGLSRNSIFNLARNART